MSIAVVRKTVSTLEKLAESEEPLSLAALSALAKLPKPTAHRILQTLATLGYVAQDGTSRYYLTSKLDSLAQSSRHRDLKLRAVSAMTALHRQFNETVNLGILEGTKVHYIHVIETTRSLRMMVQPNAADEYYFTAVGRAIAAHLPEPQLDALLKSTTLRPSRRRRSVREESCKTSCGRRGAAAGRSTMRNRCWAWFAWRRRFLSTIIPWPRSA